MSYWVVTVNRETGHATSEFVSDKDDAWQRSLDLESSEVYTTVVTATKPQGRQ